MERFVVTGKAKMVFQIIELLAKGEEFNKKQELDKKVILTRSYSYQLWPKLN